MDSASIVLSGINSTFSTIETTTEYVEAAIDGFKKKAQLETALNLTSNVTELLKSSIKHKVWRIPCLDVVIRL